jgi:N-acetylglutamate synthase-like GNAT family acetyltransferase
VASKLQVRRANLLDAEGIAAFIKHARPKAAVNREDIANRFGHVVFLLAEQNERILGLLGWQVENLVVRVTDFLVLERPDTRLAIGEPLVETMEEQAQDLNAEAIVLYMPAQSPPDLVSYWETLGYERQDITDMHRAWREAVYEWAEDAETVMIKRLRDDLTHRPM